MGTPGGFDDQGVDVGGGQAGFAEEGLVEKIDIARVEDTAPPMIDFHGSGAEDVSGRMEDEGDRVWQARGEALKGPAVAGATGLPAAGQ